MKTALKVLLFGSILPSLVSSQSTVVVTAYRDKPTYEVGDLSPITAVAAPGPAAPAATDASGGNEAHSASATPTGQTTAVTSCHFHGATQFCINGDGVEGSISPAPTETGSAPTEYTGCHSHGDDTFCMTEDDQEVQFVAEESTGSSGESSSSGGKNCHFHAGVEHCLEEGESEGDSHSCEKVDRDYNIPLRIGLLFVILVTSAIGVFLPIALSRAVSIPTTGYIFTIIKQFGTGVVISTAFVHLLTHASLMWGNSCLGVLKYESTATAICMAGLFLAFLLEYFANRLAKKSSETSTTEGENNSNDSPEGSVTHQHTVVDESGESKTDGIVSLVRPNDKISVTVMEAGIVFHSILIGITLVVAGDSGFITLFVVIIFHQMFEGLALGSRVAALTDDTTIWTKIIMGTVFSLITPIGMAIGIGVLSQFNGNDPSTIIALGTLDAFSAGVLVWTGLVEMWSHDWLYGYLSNASWYKTFVALISLMIGMLLMSLLGKWA